MHDLEQLIAEWRKAMMAAPKVGYETLDELESHLRENVDQLVRSGMTEVEAFQRAVAQLGRAPTIAAEFQKLEQGTWLPVKLVIGFGVIAALAIAILLIARFGAGRTSLLLAVHVFTVTLGYTTTFLVGALGICFVGQRCVSDLSPLRMRALARVTFALGCVAVVLTAIGVVLAMIWAKAEWGRYWAWDIKEIGGFAVIVWQASFLFAHRFACGSARGILVMSLLGNIVVSLAWFGAHLLSHGLHGYGTRNYSLLLLAAVVANFAFFLIGLAPAGWLRLRRA
jgi:hypothetical protein